MDRTVKVSFYSSLVFTFFIIIIDICYLFLFANPNPWTNLKEYVSNYKFIEVLPEIIGFILLPSFLILVNGIISVNNVENMATAKLGRFFASAFVLLVSIAYFIQFAVVYPNILSQNNSLYELWMFGDSNYSIAWGLNYLGWFWGGICTLLIAISIKDRAVKMLFITYGILLSIAFIGYCIRNEMLQVILGLAWFVILPIASLRLTLLFRKILKGGEKYI